MFILQICSILNKSMGENSLELVNRNTTEEILDRLITLGFCLYIVGILIYPPIIHYTKILFAIGIILKLVLMKGHIYYNSYCRNIIILMGIYCIVLFLSSIMSPYHSEGFRGAGEWLNKSVLLLAILLMINNITHLKIMFNCFIFCLFINSLYVIYDGVFCHNLRANAIVGSYMPTGTMLFFLFAISLILLIHYVKIKKIKLLLFLAVFICSFTAIIFNGTRGIWLGIPVLTLLVLWQMLDNKKNLLLIGTVFCGIIAMLYFVTPYINSRTDSIIETNNESKNERILIWNSALHMIKDYPVLGVGTDNFKNIYQKEYISPMANEPNLEHAHNTYLEYAAENGIIGITSFILMMGYFLYLGWNMWRKNKKLYGLITACIIMVILLHGLTEFVFAHIIIANIFWPLLGTCMKLSLIADDN